MTAAPLATVPPACWSPHPSLARLTPPDRSGVGARIVLLRFEGACAGPTVLSAVGTRPPHDGFSNRAPSVTPSSRRRRQPPVGPHDRGPIGHRPPGLLETPPVPRSLAAARPTRSRGPHRPSSLRRRLCRAHGSLRGRHAAAA